MPQTKNQKRIGAIHRMNAAIRRYRASYDRAIEPSEQARLQRKIETLERDVKNTRAKVPHGDLQLGF